MGIFRSYPRPVRRVFIPSLTPAAPPASLVYRKTQVPLRLFDRSHLGYYKKPVYLAPLTDRQAALVYRKPQDLSSFFKVDQTRYRTKVHYLPSVTAAAVASLPYRKPPDLQAFFRQDHREHYAKRQAYLAPLTLRPDRALVYRKLRTELEIFRQREALKAFFYKPQRQYRLSSTVTPPPGAGSLAYQPRKVDMARFYSDRTYLYYNRTAYLRPLVGGSVAITAINPLGLSSAITATQGLTGTLTATQGTASTITGTKGVLSTVTDTKGAG